MKKHCNHISERINTNPIKTLPLDNLDDELNKIDKFFEDDMTKAEIMQETNIEVLTKMQNNNPEQDHNPLIQKHEKVLDNKIILDALKYYYKVDQNITETELPDNLEIYINSTVFFLNDKMLTKIANLEIYEKMEELHLQRNFIKQIEGLKYLKNLQILNLNDNYISRIEGISHLKNLKILNLGDNIIEDFNVNEIPENVSFLYLFDNIFFDKYTSVLDYRSFCIRGLNELVRLDYIDVEEVEKLILMDPSNLKKGGNRNMVEKRLRKVLDHYDLMRLERKKLVFEFENSKIVENVKNHNDNEEILIKNETNNSLPDDFFLTNENGANAQVNSIKLRAQTRVKEFEEASNERMKKLKEQLEELRAKAKEEPIITDERKEKIKEKINKVIRFEEKMKIAEEIMNKSINKEESTNIIKEREAPTDFTEDDKRDIKLDMYPNKKNIDERLLSATSSNQLNNDNSVNELTHTSMMSSNTNIFAADRRNRTHNSLLTDMSDISFLIKKKHDEEDDM